MAGKSVITVRILGDNKDLKQALGDSESRIGKFAGAAGKGMKVAAGGMAIAGAAAVVLAPKILNAGSELEALGVKSQTVFGDSLGGVQAWAGELAPALGMTEDRLVGAAAAMGDLLKPMGFTAEQAADMSTDMLDLSGALSAWSGGSRDATEVADILSKALLGEREQLKELGISISEADVQARLAAKGQEKLTGEALAQAKALATQELILEKSTDAQKAWADGSMDSIKAQNEAKASIEQLKETVIKGIYPALQSLVPIVTKVVKWVGDYLPGAFDAMGRAGRAVADWWQRTWPQIEPIVVRVAEIVVQAFNGIKNWVDTNWPAIQQTIAGVMDAVQVVVETVLGVISFIWTNYGDEIKTYVIGTFNAIRQVIGGVMKVIKGIIDTVMALISGDWGAAWDGVKDILAGVWEIIKGIVAQALNVLKTSLSVAWETIKQVVGAAWDGIAGTISGTWDRITGYVSTGVDAIIGFVGSIPRRVASAIGNGFSAIWNKFRAVVNRLIGSWNDLSFTFPSFSGDWNGPLPGGGFTVGGWTVNTPNIPRLHDGGIVPGPRGSEMLAILEAGERVTSAREVERESSGGGNVYITAPAGVDVAWLQRQHYARTGRRV